MLRRLFLAPASARNFEKRNWELRRRRRAYCVCLRIENGIPRRKISLRNRRALRRHTERRRSVFASDRKYCDVRENVRRLHVPRRFPRNRFDDMRVRPAVGMREVWRVDSAHALHACDHKAECNRKTVREFQHKKSDRELSGKVLPCQVYFVAPQRDVNG